MTQKKSVRPANGLKRAFDLVFCTLGFPLLLFLGIIISLLIYLDSGFPLIYCQQRIGKGGNPFRIYKFRTMRINAEAELAACLSSNPVLAREWAANRKLRKDPRLTRSGIFLRKTSLDELPQFINIFMGQMSLVGPRPIVAEEAAKYGRYYAEYCLGLPGLSGLWQVLGRNDTSYARRIACDHYYLNKWSLLLDIWIICRTIPAVLKGRGAY